MRTTVVISIGAINTLIGNAGEPEPRWIVPSEFHHPDAPHMIYSYLGVVEMLKNEETRRLGVDSISAFVEQLFLRHLLVNPASARVVLVESMSCTLKFKTALADVLFRRFKAPLLEFLPAQPLALIPLNLQSALVVDVGYYETIVLPVVSGVPLPHAMQSISVGSRTIHSRILASLQRTSPCIPAGFVLEEEVNSDSVSKPLSHGLDSLILDDLCKQLCFVSPRGSDDANSSQQYVPYVDRFARQYRISRDIRAHAADALFEPEDKEMPTIISLILSSILALSVDLRVKMAHKILLIGGTSMMSGFATRLLQELDHITSNSDDKTFGSLAGLRGHFELIESPSFFQSHLPWIGASIDATIEGSHTPNQITLSDFTQGKRSLPDWTSLTSGS